MSERFWKWAGITAIAFSVILALVLTANGYAQTTNTVRFPHYDPKPIKIHVVTDSPAYQVFLKSAISPWEQSNVVKFDYPPPVASCTVPQKDNTICVTTFYEDSTLGGWTYQTYLPNTGSDSKLLIQSAVVGLNTKFYPTDSPYLGHALCHEVGHNLGLNHDEEAVPSCMNNSAIDSGTFSNTPSAEDITLVTQINSVIDVKPKPTPKSPPPPRKIRE